MTEVERLPDRVAERLCRFLLHAPANAADSVAAPAGLVVIRTGRPLSADLDAPGRQALAPAQELAGDRCRVYRRERGAPVLHLARDGALVAV
jgi:hypothetical protein